MMSLYQPQRFSLLAIMPPDQQPLLPVASLDGVFDVHTVASVPAAWRHIHEQRSTVQASTRQQFWHDLLQQHPAFPAVVLLDPFLSDGMDFLHAIREDPLLLPLKLCAVTTHRACREKSMAFRAGADGYLVPPLIPSVAFYLCGLVKIGQLEIARDALPSSNQEDMV